MVVPTLVVETTDGLQVPVMAGLFVELNGNKGAALFWHNGAIDAKVGVTGARISMETLAVPAHCPASGVNV